MATKAKRDGIKSCNQKLDDSLKKLDRLVITLTEAGLQGVADKVNESATEIRSDLNRLRAMLD